MFSSSVEVDKNADRKKGKGGKTVSSYFMGQLDDLMGVLYRTEPSFIRCVVPNTHKIPGGIMTSINSKANSDKRAIAGAVHTMHAEVEEILQRAKGSEDKCKKALVDAARLADELRAEQEHTNSLSKAKKTLETQLHDLEAKFQDANANAICGGRTAMAKLECRIRELEVELGKLQSKTAENQKAFKMSERRVKEVMFQNDEDKKNQDRMTELASKLQGKIKTYKRKIEDAEEIAALNLAKFRKAQQELEECEERARTADAML